MCCIYQGKGEKDRRVIDLVIRSAILFFRLLIGWTSSWSESGDPDQLCQFLAVGCNLI